METRCALRIKDDVGSLNPLRPKETLKVSRREDSAHRGTDVAVPTEVVEGSTETLTETEEVPEPLHNICEPRTSRPAQGH